jgi:DNA repair exonuclease SbcCD ATPase subunit
MTIQLSEETVKNEVVMLEKGVLNIGADISSITIADDTSYAVATDLLKNIKNQIAALEAKRKEMVKTPNDYVKWVNDQFRPLTTRGEEIRRAIESKITEYAAIKRREQEEAERKRREEEAIKLAEQQKRVEALAEKTNSERILDQAVAIEEKREALAAAPVEVKPQTVKTAMSATSIRQQWTFEITDEAKIPRGYCKPDNALINAAIKLGERDIPGLRIFQKDIVVSR